MQVQKLLCPPSTQAEVSYRPYDLQMSPVKTHAATLSTSSATPTAVPKKVECKAMAIMEYGRRLYKL